MADQSTTITSSELLEFRRLATTYEKERDDFEIDEKPVPGSETITRIEVIYLPSRVRREYERSHNASSWLGLFGEDLADGVFDMTASRMKKRQPKTDPISHRSGKR